MADHSDDLDQLLDSALDDFHSLNLTSSAPKDESSSKDAYQENNLASSSTLMSQSVRGLGMGLPDLKMKKKGKKSVPSIQESHVSEALDKLRQKTVEAVRGLESVTGPKQAVGEDSLRTDAMMEDWVKQFEELTGSQDMETIVETMMQQLLSKEILHEPMKEIGDRYPQWLEENKAKLTEEEYACYFRQYELINDLNNVYSTEPDNFNKIVELMQKMQDCGQPPDAIVQELAPDFDLSNLGKLPPDMLESQPNCCIM